MWPAACHMATAWPGSRARAHTCQRLALGWVGVRYSLAQNNMHQRCLRLNCATVRAHAFKTPYAPAGCAPTPQTVVLDAASHNSAACNQQTPPPLLRIHHSQRNLQPHRPATHSQYYVDKPQDSLTPCITRSATGVLKPRSNPSVTGATSQTPRPLAGSVGAVHIYSSVQA